MPVLTSSQVPMQNHWEVVSKTLGRVENEHEKRLYRKHGWPSADYDKSACMKELGAYWRAEAH